LKGTKGGTKYARKSPGRVGETRGVGDRARFVTHETGIICENYRKTKKGYKGGNTKQERPIGCRNPAPAYKEKNGRRNKG